MECPPSRSRGLDAPRASDDSSDARTFTQGSPNAGDWNFSTELNYTKTHLACNGEDHARTHALTLTRGPPRSIALIMDPAYPPVDSPREGEKSIVEIYKYLAPKLRNIILYNGDVDPSVDQVRPVPSP